MSQITDATGEILKSYDIASSGDTFPTIKESVSEWNGTEWLTINTNTPELNEILTGYDRVKKVSQLVSRKYDLVSNFMDVLERIHKDLPIDEHNRKHYSIPNLNFSIARDDLKVIDLLDIIERAKKNFSVAANDTPIVEEEITFRRVPPNYTSAYPHISRLPLLEDVSEVDSSDAVDSRHPVMIKECDLIEELNSGLLLNKLVEEKKTSYIFFNNPNYNEKIADNIANYNDLFDTNDVTKVIASIYLARAADIDESLIRESVKSYTDNFIAMRNELEEIIDKLDRSGDYIDEDYTRQLDCLNDLLNYLDQDSYQSSTDDDLGSDILQKIMINPDMIDTPELLIKNKEDIIKLFHISERYAEIIDDYFSSIKQQSDEKLTALYQAVRTKFNYPENENFEALLVKLKNDPDSAIQVRSVIAASIAVGTKMSANTYTLESTEANQRDGEIRGIKAWLADPNYADNMFTELKGVYEEYRKSLQNLLTTAKGDDLTTIKNELRWTTDLIGIFDEILPCLDKRLAYDIQRSSLNEGYQAITGNIRGLYQDLKSGITQAWAKRAKEIENKLNAINQETIGLAAEYKATKKSLDDIKSCASAIPNNKYINDTEHNLVNEREEELQERFNNLEAKIKLLDAEYLELLYKAKTEHDTIRNHFENDDYNSAIGLFGFATSVKNYIVSLFKSDPTDRFFTDLLTKRQLAKHGMTSMTEAYQELINKLSSTVSISLSTENLSTENLSKLNSTIMASLRPAVTRIYQFAKNHPDKAKDLLVNLTHVLSFFTDAEGAKTVLKLAEVENVLDNILHGEREPLTNMEQFDLEPEIIALCHLSGYMPYIFKASLELGNQINQNSFYSLINPGSYAKVLGSVAGEMLKKQASICLAGNKTVEMYVNALNHTLESQASAPGAEARLKSITAYLASREIITETGTLFRDAAEVGAMGAIKRKWQDLSLWWEHAPIETKVLCVTLAVATTAVVASTMATGIIFSAGLVGIIPIVLAVLVSVPVGAVAGGGLTKLSLNMLSRFNLFNLQDVANRVRQDMTKIRMEEMKKDLEKIKEHYIKQLENKDVVIAIDTP